MKDFWEKAGLFHPLQRHQSAAGTQSIQSGPLNIRIYVNRDN